MSNKIELKIGGMHCEGCAKTLTKALLRTNGIKSAEVSFKGGKAKLEVEGTDENARRTIEKSGYKVL